MVNTHRRPAVVLCDSVVSRWYPAGGGANRPMITGPGLAGPGFYSAPGTCA